MGSQEDLTVVFRNKGDGVLLLPRREWTRNLTPSEVALCCLVQVQTQASVLGCAGVCCFCSVLVFFVLCCKLV